VETLGGDTGSFFSIWIVVFEVDLTVFRGFLAGARHFGDSVRILRKNREILALVLGFESRRGK
jgi:hypothetical protein